MAPAPPPQRTERGTPAEASTLTQLQTTAAGCTRCRRHASRSTVVFGEGDPAARLVLVGEAPGRPEDLQGRPFSGGTGNLVDTLLAENGLRRQDCYLSTVVKCRAPDNGAPAQHEIDACRPYLQQQLSLIAPAVVVAFGATASQLLLQRRVPLARVAGYRFRCGATTVIPTYEPLAALRGNGRALAALRRDVRTAAAVLDGRLPGAGLTLTEGRTPVPM